MRFLRDATTKSRVGAYAARGGSPKARGLPSIEARLYPCAMNALEATATRIAGIAVADDRFVSVDGPPLRRMPHWGLSVSTDQVEYRLPPAILYEIHYQVPRYIIVHTFNGAQGRLAVGEMALAPWTTEARGSCLIRPDLPIKIVQETPLEFLAIGVDPAFFDDLAPDVARRWRGRDDLLKTADPALAAIFGEIRRVLIAEPVGADAYLDALTAAALTRFAEWHLVPPADTAAAAETLSPAVMRRLAALVEDALDGPIRVQALADAAGLSRSHFSRAFARSFGATAQRYILSRRIARARGLLTDTNLPATCIAAQCGFATPSHLTTAFKAELGLTPTDYRKALATR